MWPASRWRQGRQAPCPHTAIRDDVTMNFLAIKNLERDVVPVDIVLDVAGGGDLLVVNKIDIAKHVDVDVDVDRMVADAGNARDGGPVLALPRKRPGDCGPPERLDAPASWRLYRRHPPPIDPDPKGPAFSRGGSMSQVQQEL